MSRIQKSSDIRSNLKKGENKPKKCLFRWCRHSPQPLKPKMSTPVDILTGLLNTPHWSPLNWVGHRKRYRYWNILHFYMISARSVFRIQSWINHPGLQMTNTALLRSTLLLVLRSWKTLLFFPMFSKLPAAITNVTMAMDILMDLPEKRFLFTHGSLPWLTAMTLWVPGVFTAVHFPVMSFTKRSAKTAVFSLILKSPIYSWNWWMKTGCQNGIPIQKIRIPTIFLICSLPSASSSLM